MIRTLLIGALTLLPILAVTGLAAADEPGQKLYQRCAACHLPGGEGVPGAYPPLKGHIGDLLQADGGRAYVVAALDRGVMGGVEVAGVQYRGMMPAQTRTLSDEDVAALLNYLISSFAPQSAVGQFAAAEVAELRAAAKTMTPKTVHAARPAVGGAK